MNAHSTPDAQAETGDVSPNVAFTQSFGLSTEGSSEAEAERGYEPGE